MLDKLLLSDKDCLILINNVPHFPFFLNLVKARIGWLAFSKLKFYTRVSHASDPRYERVARVP